MQICTFFFFCHFCVHTKPGEEEGTPSGASYQRFSDF